MIICVCKNINEDKLKEACLSSQTFKEVQQKTGVSTQCGQCAKQAKDIFNDIKNIIIKD